MYIYTFLVVCHISTKQHIVKLSVIIRIGSMYAIYGNIYHQHTPNVSIYSMHGSYGLSNECRYKIRNTFWAPRIGRKPSDRVLHDRESYSLAAGVVVEPVGRDW